MKSGLKLKLSTSNSQKSFCIIKPGYIIRLPHMTYPHALAWPSLPWPLHAALARPRFATAWHPHAPPMRLLTPPGQGMPVWLRMCRVPIPNRGELPRDPEPHQVPPSPRRPARWTGTNQGAPCGARWHPIATKTRDDPGLTNDKPRRCLEHSSRTLHWPVHCAFGH